MQELNIIQTIAIWALPVIFAITLHEAAHGWVAARLGDKTAQMLGRVTLNPIKHIDPLGTVILPGVMLAIGGFVFGWAKPVPVVERNLRTPVRDMALVALAGPAANLLMAILWLLVLKLGLLLGESSSGEDTAAWLAVPLFHMGKAGIIINVILMVLNLLPIPPLDGSRVLRLFLPKNLIPSFDSLERYGFIVLLLLLATGVLGKVLGPMVQVVYQNIISLI